MTRHDKSVRRVLNLVFSNNYKPTMYEEAQRLARYMYSSRTWRVAELEDSLKGKTKEEILKECSSWTVNGKPIKIEL